MSSLRRPRRLDADSGPVLLEIAPDVSLEEVRAKTGFEFAVADPLPSIQL